LRRVLLRKGVTERAAVRPGARLAELFPVGPARGKWPGVVGELGVRAYYTSWMGLGVWFPPAHTTVRDLVGKMAIPRVHDYSGPADEFEGFVWGRIQRIVSEQMGIAVEEVRRESRFVEDLGMG
jgi:hypothetical protein